MDINRKSLCIVNSYVVVVVAEFKINKFRFSSYLKLFIDELVGWPSMGLKSNEKKIGEKRKLNN